MVSNSTTSKTAETNYSIEAPLEQRWSPLAFDSRSVEADKLGSLLEAARWSASSFNEQPWRYIIATKENSAEFDRLLDCLAAGNQEWAKNAPVLMLSVAKKTFTYNGAENRHAFHDVGAASANLAAQAAALGLFVHQMAGFDVDKAKQTYGIPEDYDPVAAIAIGYLGDPAALSEKLQQREAAPRTRRPLNETVFSGQWERSALL